MHKFSEARTSVSRKHSQVCVKSPEADICPVSPNIGPEGEEVSDAATRAAYDDDVQRRGG